MNSLYNSAGNLSVMNDAKSLIGSNAEMENQSYVVYPGSVCFDWNNKRNGLTIISDGRLNKMNQVNWLILKNKVKIKKITNLESLDRFKQ